MDPCTFLGGVAMFIGGPLALQRVLKRRELAGPEEPAPSTPDPPAPVEAPVTPEPAEHWLTNARPLVSVGPGARVGPWLVEDELGHGGMAVVWQVRRGADRYALKQLLPHFARVPTVSARFLSEAELLLQLRHPGIVQAVELVDHQGVVGFVMELLEGRTLAGWLEEHGPLTPPTVTHLGLQTLEALRVVHEAGVVHRDVKPSNLFLLEPTLDAVPRVKVMDLGIAKLADEDRTRTGTFLGTPAYMSPEQVRSPRQVDPRSDLFSLGAVLYEALVGSPPFQGPTDWEVQQNILLGRYAPLPDRIPDPLAEVVHQALSLSPEDRFASADHFAEALERWDQRG